MADDFYAVVMAGGRGERFWPQSRASRPKQLLRLIGNLTLIEQTVERLKPLVSDDNTLIITNRDYVEPMRSLMPQLNPLNIIGEPFGRDTGPCVALAVGIIRAMSKGNDEAVMCMLPSDQIIRDSASMREVLADAGRTAVETGKIVTIGITPEYPSTGYGYIKCGAALERPGRTVIRQSEGFKEKPDAETAARMLAEGSYRWNSGIFIWTVGSIMNAFRRHAPELAALADAICHSYADGEMNETILEEYGKCERISIDYAVMEKLAAEEVLVAESTFDWDDVGSWTSLRNQVKPDTDNNVVQGLFEGLNVHNSIIVSDSSHLVTAIDIEDMIIVHTEDATLVCKTPSAQRVKELIARIAANPDLDSFL
jgi:mannose-1-phosphate guanylyltransferase